MTNNVVDLKEHLQDFALPGITFSVSGRKVRPNLDMHQYLKLHYMYVDISRIDSVFGAALFPSLLYGGRPYDMKRALTNIHLRQLAELGIHFSITMTNHYVNDDAYEQSRSILERCHVQGNSIICTSNGLAKKIKRDFPRYSLRSSIMQKLDTIEKIETALELYDLVVIPMEMNDDDDFLEKIPWKNKVMLFANANCGYRCNDRSCWLGVSQFNQGREETADCSKTLPERQKMSKVFFNVGKFYALGYRRFKLIPLAIPEYVEQVAATFTANKQPAAILKRYLEKPSFYLCSYPKSGRTWLRYLLANYLNLRFQLGLTINFRTFFLIVPHSNLDEEKGVGVYDYYDDKRFPLIMASHDAYDAQKFGGKDVIFLLRSVYDTVVSRYFQHSRVFTEDRSWKGNIKEFVRSGDGILSFCSYLNSWSAFLEDNSTAHIMTYEDLHRDAYETVRLLLERLNIPVDRENLEKAVTLSSFEAMKEVEKVVSIPGVNFDFSKEDAEAVRVRKGVIGGYREYLDEEDIEYIRSFCEENLSVSSKTILSRTEKQTDC